MENKNLAVLDDYKGFIRVDGRKLVDENGKEYYIKSINLTNKAISKPKTADVIRGDEFTEDSMVELKEMGFNGTRFLINYDLFEDDATPYTYKEEGFEWLKENLDMHRRHGLRMCLNMHVHQGGFQSWQRGDDLWKEENMRRLAALWKAIAERFKDDPALLGYGLINEPLYTSYRPQDVETDFRRVFEFLCNTIREVDTNHMMFVERIYAIKDLNTKIVHWGLHNNNGNFVLINDNNTVYEFHDYAPFIYTHQVIGGTGLKEDPVYPSYDKCRATGRVISKFSTPGQKADVTNPEWQFVESDFYTFDGNTDEVNVIGTALEASYLGENGVAYFDNMTLKEYDANGNFIRDFWFEDFETPEWKEYRLWSEDGSGKWGLSIENPYQGRICYKIAGIKGLSSISKNKFVPTKGNMYKVNCYIKVVNAEEGAIVRPKIDACHADNVEIPNIDLLRKSMQGAIDFSTKYNVPVYCGESGLVNRCFDDNRFGTNRGGGQWIEDMLGLFYEANIGFAYFMYKGGRKDITDFGMYRTYAPVVVGKDRIANCYNALCNALSKMKK